MSEDQAQQENYQSLPLEDRLTHKVWKARLEAYDELGKMFLKSDGPKDPIFRQYMDSIRSLPAESNAAALESALTCLLSFLQVCSPETCSRLRPAILPTLIEKGLVAAKPGVRSKAVECALMFVELEQAEPVIVELSAFLGHKQPKLISAVLSCTTRILEEFGLTDKQLVKQLVKMLPPAFQHADKSVRGEASNLAVEIYRWIGHAIDPFLEPLKPIQVKELQEQFGKIGAGQAKPKRFLRSQQHQQHISQNVEETVAVEDAVMEEASPSLMDPYELAEPVKITLPGSFEEMVESPKWKERKDALDELLALLKGSVRIAEGGVNGSIVQTLVKRLGDANILVVISAAGCLEAMARGLRKGMGPTARHDVLPALLERSKEKKQSVTDALRSCLDVLGRMVLPPVCELLEQIQPFLAHKNPQVRAECLQWMTRTLQPSAIARRDVKSLTTALLPTLEDGSPDVREASQRLLAALLAGCGSATVLPFLEGVEKGRMARITELAREISPSREGLKAEPVKSSNEPVKRSAPPSTPAKPSARQTAGTPVQPMAKLAKTDPENAEVTVRFRYTDEAVLAMAEERLPAEIFAGLSDGVWKGRLEAVDALPKFLSGEDGEMVARLVGVRPGWKESNFQVYQRILQLFLRSPSSLNPQSVSLLAGPTTEKLSDAKIGPDAIELLLASAEQVGLPFVLGRVLASLQTQKAPKSQAETLKWIRHALLSFGVGKEVYVEVMPVVRTFVVSANPLVRSAAISLATLLRQASPAIRGQLCIDLPAPIVASMDGEYERVAHEALPPPTKRQNGGGVANRTDENIPSVDKLASDNDKPASRTLTDLVVPAELLQMLGDGKWQSRKEAMDQLATLIPPPNCTVRLCTPELPNELRARLSDTNKNLIIQALEITGQLCLACTCTSFPTTKTLLPAITACLADNKLQVRQAALKCLDAVVGQPGLKPSTGLLPGLLTALTASDSPNLRRELLAWITARLPQMECQAEDVQPLATLCLSLLQDRTMEVRRASQSLLGTLLSAVLISGEQLRRLCQDLPKPPMPSALQALIDAHPPPAPIQLPSSTATASGIFARPLEGPADAPIAEAMERCMEAGLATLLLSPDPSAGLARLSAALKAAQPEERTAIIAPAHLSLLLRYLSSRLPTSMDVLGDLLGLVDASNARLSESDATHIVPSLIGCITRDISKQVKNLFRQLCRIYPASRLFAALSDHLQTAELPARQCQLCLEEMGALLARNGLVVLNAPKHIPVVVAMIRREDVQPAALSVLVRLVGLMGDQMSRYLGELTPAELALLEHRMQQPVPDIDDPIPDVGNINNASNVNSNVDGPFALDWEQFEESGKSRVLTGPSTPVPSARLLSQSTPPYPHHHQQSLSMVMGDDPLAILTHHIQSAPDLACIHALQRLEEQHLSPDSQSSHLLSAHLNSLLPALAIRLGDCRMAEAGPEKERLGRYVTNALVILCSQAELASQINDDSLILLLHQTLLALTTTSSQMVDPSVEQQRSRALNILLVKTLENAPKDGCYHALLVLLEQAFRQPPASPSDRYPEFVMKCLWKLTKQIPAHLQAGLLSPPRLLAHTHAFLAALPPLEWKGRAAQRLPFEDLPLRTIKTILHELVVAKGSDIMACLSAIPHQHSFVTSYLKAMLQAANLPFAIPVVETVQQIKQLSVDEVSSHLKDICGRICSRPNTRSGLTDLWTFQQAHPYAASQIDAYLEQLGSFFYKYIKRNLAQLDTEHRTKHDPAGTELGSYKAKLAQMQQTLAEGGLVRDDGNVSPVRSRLDSPLLKMPQSPALTRPLAPLPVKDSSIVNLKERLARLRTSSSQPQ